MKRVLRGGSWSYGPIGQRVSCRGAGYPVIRCCSVGFRLVCSAF